jgi:quercetin dioxygenase-like cupin family protein
MTKIRVSAAAALIGACGMALYAARAQRPDIRRTELQRHDLSILGREVIQVRVDFEPGVTSGAHSHPGEEIVYVIEGVLEYEVEGRPSLTLAAGEVLFIPARTTHSARNVGKHNAAELATYVVEPGQPLVEWSK